MLEFIGNAITNAENIPINFDYFISKKYIIKFIIHGRWDNQNLIIN